jgi:hypothetical protein
VNRNVEIALDEVKAGISSPPERSEGIIEAVRGTNLS